MDLFDHYLKGVNRLYEALEQTPGVGDDTRTMVAQRELQLRGNRGKVRREEDSPALRADRGRILRELDGVAQEYFRQSFLALCLLDEVAVQFSPGETLTEPFMQTFLRGLAEALELPVEETLIADASPDASPGARQVVVHLPAAVLRSGSTAELRQYLAGQGAVSFDGEAVPPQVEPLPVPGAMHQFRVNEAGQLLWKYNPFATLDGAAAALDAANDQGIPDDRLVPFFVDGVICAGQPAADGAMQSSPDGARLDLTAFTSARHDIVFGAPGTGRSMYRRRLAKELHDKGHRVVEYQDVLPGQHEFGQAAALIPLLVGEMGRFAPGPDQFQFYPQRGNLIALLQVITSALLATMQPKQAQMYVLIEQGEGLFAGHDDPAHFARWLAAEMLTPQLLEIENLYFKLFLPARMSAPMYQSRLVENRIKDHGVQASLLSWGDDELKALLEQRISEASEYEYRSLEELLGGGVGTLDIQQELIQTIRDVGQATPRALVDLAFTLFHNAAKLPRPETLTEQFISETCQEFSNRHLS